MVKIKYMKISWFNLCVGVWITLQGLFITPQFGFACLLVFLGILNLLIGFGGMEYLIEKYGHKDDIFNR